MASCCIPTLGAAEIAVTARLLALQVQDKKSGEVIKALADSVFKVPPPQVSPAPVARIDCWTVRISLMHLSQDAILRPAENAAAGWGPAALGCPTVGALSALHAMHANPLVPPRGWGVPPYPLDCTTSAVID